MPHVTPQTSALKTCPKCREVKSLDQFAKDSTRASGVSSYCKACRNQWSKDNSEYLKRKATEWQRNNRDRAIASVRRWEEKNPGKKESYREKTDARYPERARARQAVRSAVYRGKFPPAWAMVCEICQEAQAASWHHHLGWEEEHQMDVQAVCDPCHGLEHRKNGN